MATKEAGWHSGPTRRMCVRTDRAPRPTYGTSTIRDPAHRHCSPPHQATSCQSQHSHCGPAQRSSRSQAGGRPPGSPLCPSHSNPHHSNNGTRKSYPTRQHGRSPHGPRLLKPRRSDEEGLRSTEQMAAALGVDAPAALVAAAVEAATSSCRSTPCHSWLAGEAACTTSSCSRPRRTSKRTRRQTATSSTACCQS